MATMQNALPLPAYQSGYRHVVNDLGELVVRDHGDLDGKPLFNVTFFENGKPGYDKAFAQAIMRLDGNDADGVPQYVHDAREGKYNSAGIMASPTEELPYLLECRKAEIHKMASQLITARKERRIPEIIQGFMHGLDRKIGPLHHYDPQDIQRQDIQRYSPGPDHPRLDPDKIAAA